MSRIIFVALFIACFACVGCANTKITSTKSPCVARNGGPCDRIPVNEWWMQDGYRVVNV